MGERDTLELKLKCDRAAYPESNRQASDQNSLGQTVVAHQYTTYPLRVSGVFRLDQADANCAYLYLINTSPGLLAQDHLSMSLSLAADTRMYLTDQAATKVHAMPKKETQATTAWNIDVGAGASLEFVPEPVILFADAALEQTTQIKLYPQAALFWSDILIPGRLARGEYYDFRHYHSRLEIYSDDGELWFRDTIRLTGKDNPFKHHDLFATEPILANIIMVQPQADLAELSQKIANLAFDDCKGILVASSTLPENKGLLIRVMAAKTSLIKKYITYVLNYVRHLSDRPDLPYIPK
jgi:urease accessory protein